MASVLTHLLVRRVRRALFNEFSAIVHTVHRMRRLRGNSEEIRHYLFSFLRHARRESLVPHQFLACHRHLYRFKKFGGLLRLWMPLRYLKLPPAIPQHSRLHDIQESNDYTYCEYLILF